MSLLINPSSLAVELRVYRCEFCRDEPPDDCWCDEPDGCRHCTGWACPVCHSVPEEEDEGEGE